MNRRKQTIDTYDKLASVYEQRFMDMTIYNESYDLFCELVPPSGEVFEIGTGPGNIAKYLLDRRPGFKLFGIDAAPSMITLAEKNNPAAVFEVMDCTEIAGIDRMFDGIISGFVLPYLSPEEAGKLIGDCSALLKDKGAVYLSFVAGNYEDSRYQTSSNGEHSVFFQFHPLEVIEKELTQNGFEIKHNLEVTFQRSADTTEIHNVLIGIKL